MKAAEAIVKILEAEGITDAFGIPGAGINAVYEYLGKSEKIKHYTMRHEEACVHAADAYCRASGRMALAICTAGPGATNFVTGIYTANIDSIPLIAITGQANVAQLHQDPFQCVDIAKICEPIAKATFCVTDPKEVPSVMRRAFKIAQEGKQGPVLIDLPLDVQMAEIDYDPATDKPLPRDTFPPEMSKIEQAIDMLTKAKNPVMVAGGGIISAGGEEACKAFAEYMHLPVITTYMATGLLPKDHPLNAGHMGIQVGAPFGNKLFLDSDVVLGIGCRFSDRHTGNIAVYKGERTFIHINISAKEIDKVIKADLGIVSDAKLALEALLKVAKEKVPAPVAAPRVATLRQDRAAMERKTDFDCTPIKPQRVYHEMNKVFGDDVMFTTGCGLTQIWSGQFQDANKSRMYLPSGGAGTLGFDIPAAFGAMIAQPKQKAVAVMGDFGFTFLVEELAVAANYKVPLVVVIVNNAYLGLIRQNQKYAYGYEYAVKMEANHTICDYVKVAEGFGCKAERVFKPEDIADALKRAYASDMPYVVEIITEEATDCSMGGAINAVREF